MQQPILQMRKVRTIKKDELLKVTQLMAMQQGCVLISKPWCSFQKQIHSGNLVGNGKKKF